MLTRLFELRSGLLNDGSVVHIDGMSKAVVVLALPGVCNVLPEASCILVGVLRSVEIVSHISIDIGHLD